MTALRTLQQHGFDSQNGVGRPVLQAELLQTLHFGSRAQEHNSSSVPEPRPLLSTLLSLYMTLALKNFLLGLRCYCFIWTSLLWEKRGLLFFAGISDVNESSDEMQKAQHCSQQFQVFQKLRKETKICCHSVEVSLAVLENFVLFLSSTSGPFSQGRSAKMEILV